MLKTAVGKHFKLCFVSGQEKEEGGKDEEEGEERNGEKIVISKTNHKTMTIFLKLCMLYE